MNFAVIIPTRDRPQFFEHCREQMARQTLKPSKVYAINYPSDNEDIDLVQRVKVGVDMAKSEGFDLVFIVEDDDHYPDTYFESFQRYFSDHEFFGDESTTYFNLRNKTYRTWHHPNRSSLFTTGFKISALNLFNWPADNEKFLDIKIWDYARRRKRAFVPTGAIGIKHSFGLCAGRGHIMRMKYFDKDLSQLKSLVSDHSFQFYSSLIKSF